jgi:hypothetical protein
MLMVVSSGRWLIGTSKARAIERDQRVRTWEGLQVEGFVKFSDRLQCRSTSPRSPTAAITLGFQSLLDRIEIIKQNIVKTKGREIIHLLGPGEARIAGDP